MLAIASPAMATIKAKVPKQLYVQATGWGANWELSYKSIGSIQDYGTKIKTYIVTGRDYYGLITGTAYSIPGTTTLTMSLSGMNQSGGGRAVSNYEVFFDTISQTGTFNYMFHNTGNGLNENSNTLYAIDCNGSGAYYDPPADALSPLNS